MTTRKASTADWDAVLALIHEHPDTLMQDHLPAPEDFFVAEEDGTIVACCALEIYSKRLAEIRSLAVREAFRGRGLARALVDACVARAKEEHVYEVLSITSTPEFFEKQGFGTFHNEKYALIKILG